MAHEICLHPDLIDEVIEELFDIDVISNDQLKKLKIGTEPTDPNIVMDIRHKEVKKESLIDFDVTRKASDIVKGATGSTSKNVQKKVKDLKLVDKEIFNTRKSLELFQNKWEIRNEDLRNSISILERQLKFDKTIDENYSHDSVKLNEQETIHYFNLHLDRLENNIEKTHQKKYSKTWRPTEQTSPLINVITTLKDSETKTSFKTLDRELEFFPSTSNVFKQIYLPGKSFETSPENQVNQTNSQVSSISPTYDVNVKILDDRLTPKIQKIILKVTNTWKSYVQKRKIEKWTKEKESQLKKALLQKYLFFWISHSKLVMNTKNSCLRASSDVNLEIKLENFYINQKMIKLGNFHVKAESDCNIHHEKNKIKIDEVQITSTKKHNVETMDNNVKIISELSKGKRLHSHPETPPYRTEIHVKTLTPQDVGLLQMKNTTSNPGKVNKKRVEKQAVEAKDSYVSSQRLGEPIMHRFEAQEKIIKQQRELIEKQSRAIFDLQTKCIEIESKLNCTLAERKLIEAETYMTKTIFLCDNKQRKIQEIKSLKPSKCKKINNIKNQDKSEIIVKKMLDRHAYCSQLAEQTKLRKTRMEEERQKLKVENEEKQKQEKKEERRKRLKQKMLEQQLAQEKERNMIASKKYEAALLEIASNHYLNTLLRRTFNRIKLVYIEVVAKFEDCDKIYRRKILCKIFNIWKEEVKVGIQSKCEFAERHYKEKLLRLALGKLCKMYQDYKLKLQVSEDLYSLKLQDRIFQRWQAFVAQQFLKHSCQIELAERFYRRHLLKHSFQHWKELPRLMLKDRKREQRRQAWRYSVKQLIPDFTPAYVDEM